MNMVFSSDKTAATLAAARLTVAQCISLFLLLWLLGAAAVAIFGQTKKVLYWKLAKLASFRS